MNENLGMKAQGTWAKVLSGIVVLLSLAAGIWAYPHLPARVPSHWNAAGQIDGYSSAFQGAFLLPLILLAIYIMFWVIPYIDPKKMNYIQMSRIYWLIGLCTILFLALIYFGTLAVALGYLPNLPRWYFSGTGILFIILGNYFGKLKFNYFVGIRIPWTLANEEVWYKTHRFAGPVWVAGGLLLLVTGFLPAALVLPWFLIIIAVIAVVPTVYAYLVFRQVAKR